MWRSIAKFSRIQDDKKVYIQWYVIFKNNYEFKSFSKILKMLINEIFFLYNLKKMDNKINDVVIKCNMCGGKVVF